MKAQIKYRQHSTIKLMSPASIVLRQGLWTQLFLAAINLIKAFQTVCIVLAKYLMKESCVHLLESLSSVRKVFDSRGEDFAVNVLILIREYYEARLRFLSLLFPFSMT